MQIKILNRLGCGRALYKGQKKRMIVSLFVLILSLVYFRNLNTRRHMKEDVLYWERQSLLTKSLLSEVKSEQAVINLLKQQADSQHRFIILSPGQDMLELVKDYARRMNVNIVNMKADAGHAQRHQWRNVVVIDSRVIRTLAIEIEAECGYVNLVRYLDTLYRVAPAFLSVERLKMSKNKKNPGRLNAQMELRFYSLS